MASEQTSGLASLATGLPDELRVRRATEPDLERRVDFHNRYATASQWLPLDAARHRQATSPNASELALIVEDPSGEVVATGETSDGGLLRSADDSWTLSLRVAEPWRRRGIASALLEVLETHARANAARRLVVQVRGGDAQSAHFAARHAYKPFHERIDSYIDVPSFDASAFEDPEATASRVGVRFATYAELMTEHAADVEAFQRAMYPTLWAMARDVPSATPMPEAPPPFELVQRLFFGGPGIDPETSIFAVRDGTVVGLTITTLKETGTAYTNFTGVTRSERGSGIALALKLRALQALKDRGAKLFGTTNDEQNAAMRSINRKLGYVADAPTVMHEKTLA
jgi:GNAT superfamily N-acetyltransferase